MKNINLKVPDSTEVISVVAVYLDLKTGKQMCASSLLTNSDPDRMGDGKAWIVPDIFEEEAEAE